MADAKHMIWIQFALITGFLVLSLPVVAKEMTDAEKLKWFNSDEPVKKKKEINEGQLTFLDRSKHKNVMHSDNRITINKTSLKDGWVKLHQCYRNLDAFPKVEVVYRYRQIKNIKLLSYKKIKTAKVEGKSVQLEQVSKGATLCVQADVLSLSKMKNGEFRLTNGPFRRKFLDGYFPLQVTVQVNYPKSLKIKKIQPINKGLKVSQKANQVTLNAVFEGVLNTKIDWGS